MEALVLPAWPAWPAAQPLSPCLPLLTFVSLVVTVIRQKLEAERLLQASWVQPQDDRFHFIVVGGGSAGSTLAARLSEVPAFRVLLLERGGTEPDEAHVPGFADINLSSDIVQTIQAEAEPQSCNGTGCQLTVGRVLGGGSSVNFMLYVRGNHRNYDEWAEYTSDDSWRFENVLQYFKRLEDNLDPVLAADTEYHSTSGPVPFSHVPYRSRETRALLQGLKDLGLPQVDINGRTQLGHTFSESQARGGERWSAYRSYLQPALRAGRPNLDVRTFAEVQRVLFDQTETPPRAYGVEYKDAAGRLRRATATREVLLAAGALNTAYILLKSGVGPASQLREADISVVADLPVGENLQDHPIASGLEYVCGAACRSTWSDRERDLLVYGKTRPGPPPLAPTRMGPLAARGPTSVAAFQRFQNSSFAPGVPDIQLLFVSTFQHKNGERCRAIDTWRYNRVIFFPAVLHPRSRGSVRLNVTRPDAQPVVTLGYLAAEEDLATMVKAFQFGTRLGEALERRGLLSLDRTPAAGCTELDVGTDAYFRCVAKSNTQSTYHYSGTARMGRRGDPTAVVDSELRVFGVAGLRVVDTSIMPTITSGNTMTPAIMIAEKTAALIRSAESLV